jgi:hypothetical protein
MEEIRTAYKMLIRKLQDNLTGKHRQRWEETIKTDYKEMCEGWNDFNWLKKGSSGRLL